MGSLPISKPGSVCALIMRDGDVCRVTRRNKPGDYALVGGSIEPTDKSPWDAMVREVEEEVGVTVIKAKWVFERVNETDGKIAWCYLVEEWEGEPHNREPGIEVSWGKPQTLLAANCTFRDYNVRLFTHLRLI
jgi:ADP-ribose pyrophosphatase YjhB (NUDIX family)